MRKGGVEPPHPNGHRNLNPARLPIPPLSQAVALIVLMSLQVKSKAAQFKSDSILSCG